MDQVFEGPEEDRSESGNYSHANTRSDFRLFTQKNIQKCNA